MVLFWQVSLHHKMIVSQWHIVSLFSFIVVEIRIQVSIMFNQTVNLPKFLCITDRKFSHDSLECHNPSHHQFHPSLLKHWISPINDGIVPYIRIFEQRLMVKTFVDRHVISTIFVDRHVISTIFEQRLMVKTFVDRHVISTIFVDSFF